jgi:hypothetical protein
MSRFARRVSVVPVVALAMLLAEPAMLLAGPAPLRGTDPFATQLDEARQRYEKASVAADGAAVKAFEGPINAALDHGDFDASRNLEAMRARLKSTGKFDASGLPAPLKRARQEWADAHRRAAETLVAAMDRAIRGYTKARQPERADALKRERDALAREAAAAGAASAAAPEGLVLRLSFEPQSVPTDGDQVRFKDLSGNGNDGAQRGTVKAAKDPRGGRAAAFDGRGADISCGGGDSLKLTDALTVAALVRPASANGPIVSKDDWKDGNHARGFVLRVQNGAANFAVGDGEPDGWHQASGRAPLQVGRWYHLAGTFDGRLLRVYVDGKEVATDAFEGKIADSPFPLVIGRGTYDRARIFTGEIDEVTVFNRALSAQELREVVRAK